jgi:hypothetical protein
MGVLSNAPRDPVHGARQRRMSNQLTTAPASTVTIAANTVIPVVTSDETDSTDLNTSPTDGEIVLLFGGGSTAKLCVAFGGNWYEETLTQMS